MSIKKTFLIFLTTIVAAFGTVAQQSTFSGKITGFAAKGLSEFQLYYDGTTQKVKVDKETLTFSADLNLKTSQFIEVKTMGNAINYLYAVQGNNIELVIDKPILGEAVLTIDEGNIKKLNQPLELFFSELAKAKISIKSTKWMTELVENPEVLDKALTAASDFISGNKDFIEEIAPGFLNDFAIFSDMLRNYVKIDDISIKQIEQQLEGISKSEMKTTWLTIPAYREYIVDLTNAYAARKLESYGLALDFLKEGHIPQYIAAETCLKYIPSKAFINYLFYDKVSRELMVNNAKHPDYVDFLFANSSKSVYEAFGKKYEEYKANSKGNKKDERVPAKDFEFHDVSGKLYHLADFKGKLLLLDFWASWCAPCKVQIPYMKELEKKYEGKNIIFASVSLDASKEAWLKGVKDEDLHNLVLHAEGNFKNAFPVTYGINAIPRFMLIDAEGKIISDNLPKPQFKKEVMALIDADLYKTEINQIINKHIEALGAEKLKSGLGYSVKSLQSFMGIEVDLESKYLYPKTLRYDFKPVYNEKLVLSVGEDFFKSRYFIIDNDRVFGDLTNLKSTLESWQNKLPGFELFLSKNVTESKIDLAEENSTNSDNQYVLKATFSNRTEKYFIDKTDLLIKKIILTSKVTPRKGGGLINADVKYDNYKNINGVMIPHLINMNNMITVKVTEAAVKPIDQSVFTSTGN